MYYYMLQHVVILFSHGVTLKVGILF